MRDAIAMCACWVSFHMLIALPHDNINLLRVGKSLGLVSTARSRIEKVRTFLW